MMSRTTGECPIAALVTFSTRWMGLSGCLIVFERLAYTQREVSLSRVEMSCKPILKVSNLVALGMDRPDRPRVVAS